MQKGFFELFLSVNSLCSHNPRIEEDEIRFLLRWLADQLKKDSIEVSCLFQSLSLSFTYSFFRPSFSIHLGQDLCIAVSALMRLLRRPEFRIYFKEEDGLNLYANASLQSSKYISVKKKIKMNIWIVLRFRIVIQRQAGRSASHSAKQPPARLPDHLLPLAPHLQLCTSSIPISSHSSCPVRGAQEIRKRFASAFLCVLLTLSGRTLLRQSARRPSSHA